MKIVNPRIRYDWAIKALLRDKGDFSVLEDMLKAILNRPITIVELLESESNQNSPESKQTRVDILAREADGSLITIEVHNVYKYWNMHRMAYYAANLLTDSIGRGQQYDEIRKIISITFFYYTIDDTDEYSFVGETKLVGTHTGEELELPKTESDKTGAKKFSDICPTFYLFSLGNYINKWEDLKDQWLYLLKYDDVPQDKPNVLPEVVDARDKVHEILAQAKYKAGHDAYIKQVVEEKLRDATYYNEGLVKGEKIGIEKGKAEGLQEGELKGKLIAAKAMIAGGMSVARVAAMLELSEADIKDLG